VRARISEIVRPKQISRMIVPPNMLTSLSVR
jgi:hypothetical protein